MVDEELVHIEMMISEDKRMIVVKDKVEDVVGDVVIQLMGERGVHAIPIEPIVEHAYHRRLQRKKKAPSCSTH